MYCSNKHKKHCSPAHAYLVDEYRAARHAAELKREHETRGFKKEMEEYEPIITFKDWLEGSRYGSLERS